MESSAQFTYDVDRREVNIDIESINKEAGYWYGSGPRDHNITLGHVVALIKPDLPIRACRYIFCAGCRCNLYQECI